MFAFVYDFDMGMLSIVGAMMYFSYRIRKAIRNNEELKSAAKEAATKKGISLIQRLLK